MPLSKKPEHYPPEILSLWEEALYNLDHQEPPTSITLPTIAEATQVRRQLHGLRTALEHAKHPFSNRLRIFEVILRQTTLTIRVREANQAIKTLLRQRYPTEAAYSQAMARAAAIMWPDNFHRAASIAQEHTIARRKQLETLMTNAPRSEAEALAQGFNPNPIKTLEEKIQRNNPSPATKESTAPTTILVEVDGKVLELPNPMRDDEIQIPKKNP